MLISAVVADVAALSNRNARNSPADFQLDKNLQQMLLPYPIGMHEIPFLTSNWTRAATSVITVAIRD